MQLKRKRLNVAGISLSLPIKLYKELIAIYKSFIDTIGYNELEKRFPTFFTFFLRGYENKHRKKEKVIL